jgi:hypothetical protein
METQLERKTSSGRNSLVEVPEPQASPRQRSPLETIISTKEASDATFTGPARKDEENVLLKLRDKPAER